MEIKVDIEFKELLELVKKLPATQLSKLKKEIESEPEKKPKRQDFKALLLSGPTFSKKQLDTIAKTRKAINQWRTK